MAPRPDLITATGRRLLRELPPILREDPEYVAVIHCYARESERVDGAIEQIRLELFPGTASAAGIGIWEALLRLPMTETDLGVRQQRAVVRYRSLIADPSRRNWISRVTLRIGNAWSWELTDTPQVIRVFLPYAPGSVDWEAAVEAVDAETPSELGIEYAQDGIFLLDASQMDDVGLGS